MMRNCSIVLLSVLLASYCGLVTSKHNNITLPTMLLHIGPHKTGSSHFQSYLVENEKQLKRNKILIWPNIYPSLRHCQDTEPSLQGEMMHRARSKQLTNFLSFFYKCSSFKRMLSDFLIHSSREEESVIFCHEQLAGQVLEDPAVVKSFMSLASVYFRVHVVINYRLSVNRYVSTYNELIKASLRRGYSAHDKTFHLFSDFSALIPKNHATFYSNVIATYKELTDSLPNSRITIVDYYGVVARTGDDQMDLNFVIMCKILRVYCDKKHIFSSDIGANPSVREAPLQMAMLFIAYARSKHCEPPHSNGSFVNFLYTHSWQDEIPLAESDLSAFTVLSLHEDLILRKLYGPRLLMANRTANEAAAKWSHPEANSSAVEEGVRWRNQFSDILLSLRAQGLCHKH